MQQEPRDRAVSGAVSRSRRLVLLPREWLKHVQGRRSHRTRSASIHFRRPAPAGPRRPGPQSSGLVSGPARPPAYLPLPLSTPPRPVPPPHLGPRQRRGRHGPAQEGGGEQRELGALQPGQRHGALATRKCDRQRQPPKPRLIRRDPQASRFHFRARDLFTLAGGAPPQSGRYSE